MVIPIWTSTTFKTRIPAKSFLEPIFRKPWKHSDELNLGFGSSVADMMEEMTGWWMRIQGKVTPRVQPTKLCAGCPRVVHHKLQWRWNLLQRKR